ncbi:MAG TPA: O-antigen ligase family protein [Vicinamibacterales bacterium]|nr:O-antigen ligase family protein [Vicinamibacterales bacterium]
MTHEAPHVESFRTRRHPYNSIHIATAIVVAWGALSFGAVYPWAYWPLAVVCLVCGIYALCRRSDLPRLPSSAAAVCLASVAAATVVQLLPLPLPLLAVLSPHAGNLLAELDIPFAARAVEHHALSIAPAATMTALALYAALATVMLGIARTVSATGPRRIAAVISGIGILLALIGIVQQPLYDGRIYGFWTPLMKGSPFGPFVNKNHFAGWMLMALPVTFGLLCANVARAMPRVGSSWRNRVLWLSSPEASHVLILGAAAVVMALSLMLTMSRSGIVAFVASVSMTSWWATRRLPVESGRLVVVGYLVCLVLFVVGWVGVDTVVARFESANPATINERLPIWQDTWQIIRDFWLTGSGLNTYGVATLFYQTSVPGFHLREAHNDYLQVAAEGGLLLGMPILCTIATLARDVRRQFADSSGSSYWIRLGAVTGLIAIALQSIVEFSLQMPGNAALAAVLLGIALHRDPRSTRPALLP